MASGELVSALVRDRLSEENARIAREILWEREEHEQSAKSEQRKLRLRLKRDAARAGRAPVGRPGADTGLTGTGAFGLLRRAMRWLAMVVVVIVSGGLSI